MPPSRYEAWLASLPEYNPEVDTGDVVIVPPISGTTGVIAVFNSSNKTVTRLRPYTGNVGYRVNNDGVMSIVAGITTNMIVEQMAPEWSSGGVWDLPYLTTDKIKFKLSQPITDQPNP